MDYRKNRGAGGTGSMRDEEWKAFCQAKPNPCNTGKQIKLPYSVYYH
jgi:hypothetical protein